ncbi:MAG: hypothetical protein IIX12_00785 [Alistipes sp.]|nr:hypothetical protein [Alistipes sp.]
MAFRLPKSGSVRNGHIFNILCLFLRKTEQFWAEKPQKNRKKWQKILFVGFIMSTFAPNSGQKTADRMCENEQKRQ